MGGRERGPWSLQRRLTLVFGLTSLILTAAIAGVSYWFVQQAAARELRALVQEEVDEVRAYFGSLPVAAAAMDELADALQKEHPGLRIAWGVWEGDTPWHTAGAPELLGELASAEVLLGQTRRLRHGVVGRREALALVPGEGPNVGKDLSVVVDGTSVIAAGRRFLGLAGVLVAVAGLLGTGAGYATSRRLTRILADIAADLDTTRAGHELADMSAHSAPVEIARVTEAMNATLGALRSEEERVGTLIAGLAHELRSPVQNLLGESQVVLMRPREAEEYRHVLESQLDELRDLAREVDNLVTFCADSERRAGVERFDLGEQLELRLPRELSRAERRGVQLDLRMEGDLGISGDREALLLVMRNLIGNAVDFTPARAKVRVNLSGKPGGVEIAVDDAGPGVEEEDLERIFLPFHQGRPRPQGRVGYGLGLALVKSTAEAHHGSVEVGSSDLGGARFVVRLPRDPQ